MGTLVRQFCEGLTKIEAVIKHNEDTPDRGDLYRSAAPYLALETIYRARGESKLARLARTTADRLSTERSAEALAQVLKDARPLFRANPNAEIERGNGGKDKR